MISEHTKNINQLNYFRAESEQWGDLAVELLQYEKEEEEASICLNCNKTPIKSIKGGRYMCHKCHNIQKDNGRY